MKVIIIGTIPPDSLLSLVTALKLGGLNPVPDMTKRMTASKLITRGSWPPMCYAVQNTLIPRSTTSLQELNLGT
jgi:hypothetical protein